MFGKLLSTAIKAVTLPIDAANIAVDKATGGDGSKRSRTGEDNPLSFLEEVRDEVAKTAEDLDD